MLYVQQWSGGIINYDVCAVVEERNNKLCDMCSMLEKSGG